MTLPVTIPNTFATATASIPLSQLDANFSTLANAVNGISDGSETLANAKITTANVTTLIVTGNATIGDASADTVTLNSTMTANTAVIFSAGTSAAPAITTSGDLNTGIYFPGADTIGFVTNGSERARITSVGNLLFQKDRTIGLNTSDGSDDGYLAIAGASADGATRGGHIYLSGNERVADPGTVVLSAGNVANGSISFRTGADVERARITSGGYFKASNDGSYVGSTSSNHEFKNTATATCVQFSSTNASFAQNILIADATPSASSSYVFLLCRSAVNADVEFNLRGDGNGYADGTWNNNGADYAEFFESANGQALTLGATVVLDNNKVREATEQDPVSAVIGVVRPKEPSKASMVVGNTAWNKWANKYLTDDFDRYIMEDHDVVEWEEQVIENKATEAVEAVVDEEGNEVSPAIPAQEATYKTISHSYESHRIPEGITVPADATIKTHDDKGNKFQHYKLNPAWDKDAEYVNRENRPEWNIIGLVGQVKVLKGQPTNDRWIKMRDVSATVEEWFIR